MSRRLGNYSQGKDIEEYSLKELIWDRAEYDIQYFEDTYVVTGHTPTQRIYGESKTGLCIQGESSYCD